MVHAVHQIMAVIFFKNKQRITRSTTTSKLTYNFCVGYQKLKTDSIVIQVEWWAEMNSYPLQNQRQICNCSVNNRKNVNLQDVISFCLNLPVSADKLQDLKHLELVKFIFMSIIFVWMVVYKLVQCISGIWMVIYRFVLCNIMVWIQK
jgi:hypothetical protein